MRTGACAVQQALTSEAASVLKHALGLARRRGHAQVTPLHVAATLLSSAREAGSLFRRACLRSHPRHRSSHPLQCRALELCFNVALNRLPTRAQAHQRRGCIEQQQQQQMPPPAAQPEPPPLLAVKVELEQLIISILDDPSVSRVMREAGFSSTSVKNSLEEDASSAPPSPVSLEHHRDIVTFASAFCPPPPAEPAPLLPSASQEEDLRVLLDVLLGKKNKRRRSNAVVVGDSASYGELLGEVPEELRSAQWVKLSGSTFASRADVEMKVSQLRTKVSSLVSWGGGGGGGVILYAGDLRWAIDEDPAVTYLVVEVGRLLSELRATGGGMVWLVAVADLQTYMNWKKRQPSLELQWGLQPVSVPSGGLALSLHIPGESPPCFPLLATRDGVFFFVPSPFLAMYPKWRFSPVLLWGSSGSSQVAVAAKGGPPRPAKHSCFPGFHLRQNPSSDGCPAIFKTKKK
ncbi:unnamed protein product [Spirodela intermedia]|uniref:Clp R domain-containing protein n=1 Tax=Spirodela intermedia TaxID=51605 RepID=A0A7I8JJN0_SPIIN|nr:unnamed protein product [Spirodela intermedia]CAA6670354.1 unnamed protein product [Spirodela intermedia]